MSTLTNISVPTKEQVDATSQGIFEVLKSKLGMVPNLYATIGYSSNALGSFLEFSGNAGKGIFNNKETEAIKLAVSQQNDCTYCKSAHTALGKMAGFSEEQTVELRNASIQDEKLNVLTNLAKEIAADAGRASDETKEKFFALGYDERALIELVSVVIAVTFTNYVYGLTKVEIDFPVVQ